MKAYRQKNDKEEREILPNEKLKLIADKQEKRFFNLLWCKGQKELFKKCIDHNVNKDWFMNEDYSIIYQILLKHYCSFDEVMQVAQYEETLRKKEENPEVISKWMEVYTKIASAHANVKEFDSLLRELKERYIQSQAWLINKKYSEKILNATEDQSSLVQEFISEVSSIVIPGNNSYTKIIEYSTALKDAWDEIEERKSFPEKFKGLPTGFKGFDEKYVLMKGKYAVFMAPEGGGKTTLMLNMALSMAKNGHHVAYVIIENDPQLTTQRTLCMYSGVNFNRILKGGSGDDGLDETSMRLLKSSKEELEESMSSKFHWVKTSQGRPASEIIKELDKIRAFCDLEAIFVDYIGIVGSDIRVQGRPDLELAHTSGQFQTYGGINNILMVTAQQMRSEKVRELQKKFKESAEFRVGTGDVSSTKEIAANCDYLFGILIDQEHLNRMYIFNAKARYSASHNRVVLNYERDSGQLSDALGPSDIEDFAEMIENEKIKDEILASFEEVENAKEIMKEIEDNDNDIFNW